MRVEFAFFKYCVRFINRKTTSLVRTNSVPYIAGCCWLTFIDRSFGMQIIKRIWFGSDMVVESNIPKYYVCICRRRKILMLLIHGIVHYTNVAREDLHKEVYIVRDGYDKEASELFPVKMNK